MNLEDASIAQRSFLIFVFRTVGSALGFVSTIYFARILGAEIIGVYSLLLTVVGWFVLVGDMGFGAAAAKRISESDDEGSYLSAFLIYIIVISTVLILVPYALEEQLTAYISGFNRLVPAYSISVVVSSVIVVDILVFTVNRVLNGENKPHLVGFLEPIGISTRSVVQIFLVLVGYQLAGMVLGYIVGNLLLVFLAIYFIKIKPSLPNRFHFKKLLEYARYSWLGSLKSRVFSEVDILLLGFFVQPSVVGVYTVSWTIAKFFDLFSDAITSATFPEISYRSSNESTDAVPELARNSVAFSGLFVIPGFVGSLLLNQRILRIYGTEFEQGTTVLSLLIFAMILYAYQKQLFNILNGIDRPDTTFWINIIFIVINVTLNTILINEYGVEGAAVASICAVAVTTVITYHTLKRIIKFNFPTEIITHQIIAAVIMGISVYTFLTVTNRVLSIQNNIVVVVSSVTIGSAVYFTILYLMSSQFRSTVVSNSL